MSLITYLFEAIYNTVKIFIFAFFTFGLATMVIQFFTDIIWDKISSKLGYKNLIYLTSVGIAIHEIGHAVFCPIFGHKIDKLVLFNGVDKDSLGYVSHSYNRKNLYHRIGNFFIGIGPILFGFFAIIIFSEILLPADMFSISKDNKTILTNFLSGICNPLFWINPYTYIWLYLVICVTLHISLSKADIEGAFDGLTAIFILLLLLNILFSWSVNFTDIIINALLKICFFSFPLLTIILFLLSIISYMLTLKVR